ncbi:MAG: 2-oxo acid dehydrogenase subunit E2 [Cyclobacteriaceae bacterium]|nr:2-oxo acid dehydrogenase subunit E2 [Cyclobacteriaceae bacterium]
MALVEMFMPKMGESIMEATVLSWLKQEGDSIDQDESLLEVATDKVDTEVPSTHAGVIKEILAKEGDVVEVGKPIALIETAGDDSGDNGKSKKEDGEKRKIKELRSNELDEEPVLADANISIEQYSIPKTSGNRFYSPLVRNIAKEEGISVGELDSIPGSGKGARVTKKDILAYVKVKKTGVPISRPVSAPVSSGIPVSISAGDEIIEMDRMRKMISERMVQSKQISPHVTSFVEADVTRIVKWRNKYKDSYKDKYGHSLTFTPIFIDAVVKAIKDYPMINIQVDGLKIIVKRDINIGMAVALPTGNLIVPVIKNADQYNLKGLAQAVNDLAVRARGNKLKPDELTGGTYSVSNVGSFGNVMGTPIIMQPQVAILALGAIQKKPAVIETPDGDMIGIRHKMFLSHSYDHRVVDGALGGMVVRKIADYLEDFDDTQII